MQANKIMSIYVDVTECFDVHSENCGVNMILFGGKAQSEYFSGKIMAGGVDTQVQKKGQARTLSARYMLEGTDFSGKACRIFIENNATEKDGVMITKPQIVTDSKVLSWLEHANLEGHIAEENDQLCIDIFEKKQEFERTVHSFCVDGRTIYGEICRPLGAEEKVPLVIASHGYNGCCEYMRHSMELLAARGVASYAYDFCGGGSQTKSSGETTQMSICTEQRDLRDVMEEVSRFSWVDKNRIYLYGESQGGFVAGLTAPEFQEQVRGLFLVFPAFCIPDDWGARKVNNTQDLIECMGMTIGKAYVDGVPDYDVFAHAAKYEGPVQIFHGDADTLVRLPYSEKLQKSYKNAELTVYPEQGHGFEERYVDAMLGKVATLIQGEVK